MDLEIRTLRERILLTINESDVPMEAKRLVMIEILSEISKTADMIINNQIKEQKKDEEN